MRLRTRDSTPWAEAVFYYALALPAALPSLYRALGAAGLVWFATSLYEIRDSIQRRATALGAMSGGLRLGALGLPALVLTGRMHFTGVVCLTEVALMGGAAALVALNERKRTEPRPRYALEGLTATFFVAMYVLSFALGAGWLLSLILLHLGMLAVALLRTSQVMGVSGDTGVFWGFWGVTRPIRWAWATGSDEPGDLRSVAGALRSPPGAIGSTLVLAELVLFGVLALFR